MAFGTPSQKFTSIVLALYGLSIMIVTDYWYLQQGSISVILSALLIWQVCLFNVIGFSCLVSGHFMFRDRKIAFYSGIIIAIIASIGFALALLNIFSFDFSSALIPGIHYTFSYIRNVSWLFLIAGIVLSVWQFLKLKEHTHTNIVK